ncbi:MAG: hypothetical protein ABI647_04185 [Gemmatimonadota bacterium]
MNRLLFITLVPTAALVAQGRPVPSVLLFPANVRAAALAGAGVAMIGYAGSVFNNPSGLAPIRSLSVEGTIARLPDRSTYSMGAGAVRIKDFNLGGGYQYLRFPSGGPVYDNVAFAGAVVYRIGGISFGANGKYLSLEDSSHQVTRSLTTDLSATVAFFDIAALALSVRNVGDWAVSRGGLELPRTAHLGFTLNLLDTYSNGRLLATVETIWTHGAGRRTVLGAEAGVVVAGIGLVGRAGTGGEPGTPIRPFSTTTYGGGIVAGRARIDYAFQKKSPLGTSVHLFGFRWTP